MIVNDPVNMNQVNQQWLARSQAVGRAQGRYLWMLLLALVFYSALYAQFNNPNRTSSLKVPLIGLAMSPTVVLGSGPPLISFLVLAIMGSLRAYSTAREKLGLSQGADWSGEEIDIYPNAIDLAFYTTPMSPKLISIVAYFAYPGFLFLALGVAAHIAYYLIVDGLVGWRTYVVAGVLLWLPACWLVLTTVYRRIRRLPTLWSTK